MDRLLDELLTPETIEILGELADLRQSDPEAYQEAILSIDQEPRSGDPFAPFLAETDAEETPTTRGDSEMSNTPDDLAAYWAAMQAGDPEAFKRGAGMKADEIRGQMLGGILLAAHEEYVERKRQQQEEYFDFIERNRRAREQ